MTGKRIQDNPSHEHLRQQFLGLRIPSFLMWVLSLFGLCDRRKVQELRAKLKDIRKMHDNILRVADEFNAAFSKHGWIAYEHMNLEVMKECVALAQEGKSADAEHRLVAFYDEEEIGWQIARAKNHPAFMERWEQMQQAYEEYKAGRYYSGIPLLLMVIDGAVNDVDRDHGFSSEGSDVEAWDSIAGHSSGLTEIKKIYTKTRRRTNRDPIYLPYRNGILHGRDLNYANERVAAKCWGILFAVADWAVARQTEGKRRTDFEAETNPPSLGETFRRYADHRERMAEIEGAQNAWEPRAIVPGTDIPISGASEEYGDGTPERAVVEFLELWRRSNYGDMATMTVHSIEPAFGKRAGHYREIFAAKTLESYQILRIDDKGSGLTEVSCSLSIGAERMTVEIEYPFRLVYQDDQGNGLPRGMEGGSWRIVEQFSDIEVAGLGAE